MDKQNVVYTYKGVLFGLQNEILTRATTWMKLKDFMVSKRSQSQKDKHYDSTYLRWSEKLSSEGQKVEWWLPGLGRGE